MSKKSYLDVDLSSPLSC